MSNPSPATKWSILIQRRDELQRQLNDAQSYLDGMEATSCGLTCDCGQFLATEADFAKHYTVPDERYLNLGSCPIKDALKPVGWNGARYATDYTADDKKRTPTGTEPGGPDQFKTIQ
jgi:hypothetical protein